MRRFTISPNDPYRNIFNFERRGWFQYHGFDGYRWSYNDGRYHYWVILKRTDTGWTYRVKGTRGWKSTVDIVGVSYPDPQLAILTGMVFVEKRLVRPPKPPIIGPAPVIPLAKYRLEKAPV